MAKERMACRKHRHPLLSPQKFVTCQSQMLVPRNVAFQNCRFLPMSRVDWYLNRVRTWIGRPRLVKQRQAIPVAEHPRCEHPLLVLGAHRSGTSLLRRMLNSHPDIACPPESFFFEHYAKMQDDDFVVAGYDGLGFTASEMREDLARKASELHEAFRLAADKPIWADKTPQYLAHAEKIDRLFDRRPRYLMIHRHPCDIVYSLHSRGWKQNEVEDAFESQVVYVKEALANLESFHNAHPDRTARFSYEAMCDNPEEVLGRALEGVGLSFAPQMLDFASADHNFGVEDPVVRGQNTISYSGGHWRDWSRARIARVEEAFGKQIHAERYWSF